MADMIYCGRLNGLVTDAMRCVKPRGHLEECAYTVHAGWGAIAPDGSYSPGADLLDRLGGEPRLCLYHYDWGTCVKPNKHGGQCDVRQSCGSVAVVDGKHQRCVWPIGHPGDHRFEARPLANIPAALEADPIAAALSIRLDAIDRRLVHAIAHACTVRTCPHRLIITVVAPSPPTFLAADAAARALGWEIEEPRIVGDTQVAPGYKLCPAHSSAGRR